MINEWKKRCIFSLDVHLSGSSPFHTSSALILSVAHEIDQQKFEKSLWSLPAWQDNQCVLSSWYNLISKYLQLVKVKVHSREWYSLKSAYLMWFRNVYIGSWVLFKGFSITFLDRHWFRVIDTNTFLEAWNMPFRNYLFSTET